MAKQAHHPAFVQKKKKNPIVIIADIIQIVNLINVIAAGATASKRMREVFMMNLFLQIIRFIALW